MRTMVRLLVLVVEEGRHGEFKRPALESERRIKSQIKENRRWWK
jgi:hypothetical protein